MNCSNERDGVVFVESRKLHFHKIKIKKQKKNIVISWFVRGAGTSSWVGKICKHVVIVRRHNNIILLIN